MTVARPLASLPKPRTATPSRREVIAGGILLAVTGASELLKPVRVFERLSRGELEAALPKALDSYRFVTSSGLVLPPRDELSEKLYDEVVTRVYIGAVGPPVMALFAYGSVQNLSLELHRPDECYPQQGFVITKPEPVSVNLASHDIPASVLTARRANGYVEQVLFWSRIGSRFPASRTEQSLIVARENFAGRMPDGLLVRLSVPTADRHAGLETARHFLAELTRKLPPVGRGIVFGETSQGGVTA